MTYASFLLRFLFIPIVLLLLVSLWDRRRGRALPEPLRGYPARVAITAHVIVALLYTTPWDNYLVATQVWWYNPALVIGWTIGWVPIEEYTFFVVQSILTGLALLALARRFPVEPRPAGAFRSARWIMTGVLGSLWLGAVIVLWSGWQPGRYLAIQGAWALLPLTTQAAFGGDILWRHRRPVLVTLATMTLYLSLTDSLAIAAGTWTVSPSQSLAILLGGVLPLEELTFFLVTNMLLILGMTLLLARESQERFPAALRPRFPWLLPGERARPQPDSRAS